MWTTIEQKLIHLTKTKKNYKTKTVEKNIYTILLTILSKTGKKKKSYKKTVALN